MKKMICLFMLYVFNSCNLAPGSYAYAEIYKFDEPEDKLIRVVSEFKINNLDFIVPENIGLVDGRSNDKFDHWYHIWFYYKKENQIIYTWIRGNEFAFIAVNEGTELGNWKDINKDFGFFENRAEKKKFEERILNPIKAILEKKKQAGTK